MPLPLQTMLERGPMNDLRSLIMLGAGALSALLYASVRFVEAYGLWRQRHWAEWFAVLTGGIYVPLELFEITRGVSWPKGTLLIVNAGIVAYLSLIMYQSRQKRKRAIQ
jgi:uncharacterized membrane protein (DUF2068 family)